MKKIFFIILILSIKLAVFAQINKYDSLERKTGKWRVVSPPNDIFDFIHIREYQYYAGIVHDTFYIKDTLTNYVYYEQKIDSNKANGSGFYYYDDKYKIWRLDNCNDDVLRLSIEFTSKMQVADLYLYDDSGRIAQERLYHRGKMFRLHKYNNGKLKERITFFNNGRISYWAIYDDKEYALEIRFYNRRGKLKKKIVPKRE